MTWHVARPCARCGQSDRCSVSITNDAAICRTVSAWREGDVVRRDRAGEEYAFLDGGGTTDAPPPDPDLPTWREPIADEDTRHAVYTSMIEALWPGERLLTGDAMMLRKRGVDFEFMRRVGYWSHPSDYRALMDAADKVLAIHGSDKVLRTPGFFRTDCVGGTYLLGAGDGVSGGLGIPVRDSSGRIVGVRVRTVRDGKKRYTWLSTPHDPRNLGAGAKACVHVPLHDHALRNGVVRITEGEIKADIATHVTGVLTLSLPGVGQWFHALATVRELGGRRVLLAFDSDARRNKSVAGALGRLAAALMAEGLDVAVEVWPDTWKGIDDLLMDAAGGASRIETFDGADAWRAIETLSASAGAVIDPLTAALVAARATVAGVRERVRVDAKAAFAAELLTAAAALRRGAPGEFAEVKGILRDAKIALREWNRAVDDTARRQSAAARAAQTAVTRVGGKKIRVGVDEHRVTDQAIAALAPHPAVYQRGSMLVRVLRDESRLGGIIRPRGTPRIGELPLASLREVLSEVAVFHRLDETEDGEREVVVPVPDTTVRAVGARGSWRGVKKLEGVVECPVLRHDGTVLSEPGYDDATGLLYAPSGEFSAVDQEPSLDDAKDAVARLLNVVVDFPFAKPAHRAAWLASVLTPLCRYAFAGPSPLNLIDATNAGAGKSLLADIVSTIVSGRPFPRMTYVEDDEEMRKRITSMAIDGTAMVLIDNIAGRFGTPSLDAALTTSGEWKDRILGASENATFPLFLTWYGTGNNVQIQGDLHRRVLHIRLETPEAQPEYRENFAHPNILRHVAATRGELVADALTILRAWVVAGRPTKTLPAWGSYEAWSDLVRQAIVWTGQPDPGETREQLREDAGGQRNAVAMLVDGWHDVAKQFGGACTARQAIEALAKNDDAVASGRSVEMYLPLREAIGELVRGPQNKRPTASQIGFLLRGLKGTAVMCSGGKTRRMIVVPGNDKAGAVWKATAVGGGDDGDDRDYLQPYAGKNNIISHNDTRNKYVSVCVPAGESSPSSPSSPPSPDSHPGADGRDSDDLDEDTPPPTFDGLGPGGVYEA